MVPFGAVCNLPRIPNEQIKATVNNIWHMFFLFIYSSHTESRLEQGQWAAITAPATGSK